MLPLSDGLRARRFPIVNIALIVANFAVWLLYELPHLNSAVYHASFYPCAVEGPCLGVARSHLPWEESAFTGMFLHASWLHILGNMLFLWIFGNNVEDALGHVRFLVWYLSAGVVATATQTFVTLHWATLQDASVPQIGASGAIAGVLGAYIVLLPGARVLTLVLFFIPVQIPALVFLGFWFLFQLYEGDYAITHPQSGGGVAFFAHVGGFVFGLVTINLVRRRDWRPAAYAR